MVAVAVVVGVGVAVVVGVAAVVAVVVGVVVAVVLNQERKNQNVTHYFNFGRRIR